MSNPETIEASNSAPHGASCGSYPAAPCSTVVGWLCGPRIYRFEGWLFELPSGHGSPWPIKEDGTPYKRAGRVFWKMVDRFERMSEGKRESYRDGGGCVPLIQSNGANLPRSEAE